MKQILKHTAIALFWIILNVFIQFVLVGYIFEKLPYMFETYNVFSWVAQLAYWIITIIFIVFWIADGYRIDMYLKQNNI